MEDDRSLCPNEIAPRSALPAARRHLSVASSAVSPLQRDSSYAGRMDAQEERRLSRAWRNEGCRKAREQLITSHLGLVLAIARRYVGRGTQMEELVAEGNLGLVTAVDNFDPEMNTRLSTYAVYWIRHSISRVFARSSPRSKLSRDERRDLAALDRATANFQASHGRPPRSSELCEMLAWAPERVRMVTSLGVSHSRAVSLSAGVGDEVARVDDNLDERVDDTATGNQTLVAQALGGLSPTERQLMSLRFGLCGERPRRIREVASTLGVSPRVVQTRIEICLRKLRALVQSGSSRLTRDILAA